jgi:death on curing protein
MKEPLWIDEQDALTLHDLFLELDGYSFTASEEDVANAVLALAGGSMEEADYAEFIRSSTQASGAGG